MGITVFMGITGVMGILRRNPARILGRSKPASHTSTVLSSPRTRHTLRLKPHKGKYAKSPSISLRNSIKTGLRNDKRKSESITRRSLELLQIQPQPLRRDSYRPTSRSMRCSMKPLRFTSTSNLSRKRSVFDGTTITTMLNPTVFPITP